MDNQKSGIISALEVLDSLKESMKKADTLADIDNGGNGVDIKKSIIINSKNENTTEHAEVMNYINSDNGNGLETKQELVNGNEPVTPVEEEKPKITHSYHASNSIVSKQASSLESIAFMPKSNSNNANFHSNNISNGNSHVVEKGGSDYLLKSNNELEKKLKVTKSKVMPIKSMQTESKLKKISPITEKSQMNSTNPSFKNYQSNDSKALVKVS